MIMCNDEKLASVSNNSIVLTKKATFSLLRTVILLMQNLKPLPETAYLTMKLLYYDEVTPADYEPPGFKPADSPYFYFKSDPINIKVGDVVTPFHSLKLRIKTDKKQFEFEEEPKDPSPTNKTQFNCEIMDSNENIIDNILIQDSYDDFKEDKKNEPMQLRSSRKNENESCKSKSSKLDEVQCPCGLTKEDPLMLSCVSCNKRQHAICFGILDESQIPKEHLCENCQSLNSDRPPTDAYLSRLKPIELQTLCLWRQALVIASKSTTINCTFLIRQLHVDSCVANSILSRLEDEKYVQVGKGKDRKKKVVNKKRLTTEGFLKYMNQTKKHSEEFLNDNPNEKSDECGDLEKKVNIS
ncbi:meiosis-specific protein HOP1-like [Centruroides sculpturatus]|uniref:meiosis-specific protein HOP1-like n=1 Tax=Centruroides sculpturatus TaxID=218467 RepID=UPI000C6D9D44|nr:meiosis-specific protein HOP1-like [Centruroides sculpturatus]